MIILRNAEILIRMAVLTNEEVAAALDIEIFSAEELLNGTIRIRMKEVKEIARNKKVSVSLLLKANPKLKLIVRKNRTTILKKKS